jgi:type IV pilus assembly protein PilB
LPRDPKETYEEAIRVTFKRLTDDKIGEILIRQGVVSKNQVKEALELQSNEGGLLGENLVKLNFMTDRDITKAIIAQYGCPFITLDSFDFNKDAAKLIPEAMARQHKVAPIDIIGDILVVAMSNPLDATTVEYLEEISMRTVRPFIAVISDIDSALNKIYSSKG